MRTKHIFALACSLLLLLLCFSRCAEEQPNDRQDTFEKKVYLNLSDTARYVGKEVCRNCHYDTYENFIHTGMGLSFDKASKSKSSASFHSDSILYDSHRDFYYKPYWKNDSLVLLEYRLDGKDTIFSREERVHYIIGSGQHTNSHIYSSGDYLHQLPFTYYTQDGHLDFPPGFEDGHNTRHTRKIGLECMSCHNSLPDFVMGSENKYNLVPDGISCERCHGPGSIHVDQKMAGIIVDTANAIDYSIVNPRKLSPELQFELCSRCHLQGNAVLKEGMSFYDFKPGMRLTEVMDVFLPKYEGKDDEFIMASHVDRLKQSECFIQSGTLSCINCHNPHISVRLTGKEVFNDACRSCHQEKTCTAPIIDREAKNDNCYSCHMPSSGSSDIPHVSITDHKIAVPQTKEKIDGIERFLGLKSINNPNPDRITIARAYIQQYEKFEAKVDFLDSAYYYLKTELKSYSKPYYAESVNYYFLRNDFQSVVRHAEQISLQVLLNKILVDQDYSNRHAWAAYRTGESYRALGMDSKALQCFQKASQLAPYSLEFRNKLGTAYVKAGNLSNAAKEFEFIIAEQEDYVSAYTNLGFIRLRGGKTEEALQLYQKALSLDPDNEQALLNMAGWYFYHQKIETGRKYLNQLLNVNPNHVQAKSLLQQTKGE